MWDDHNVPFKWITSPASIRDTMPDWKYVLLTKDIYRDFVIKYFPNYLFYYDAFPYDIQRTNAICYMWMYKVGGVYMSLNYELVKKLDSLFYGNGEAYFVPSNNDSKWYTNSFMAAKPGCLIFLECLEAMKKLTPWWCLDRQSKILYTTGSGMLSRVLKYTKNPYNIINSYDIPSCSICTTNCEVPGSYIRRLADDSWDEWDTYFYNVLYCNWKWLLLMFTAIVVALCVYISTRINRKRKIYVKKKSKTPDAVSPDVASPDIIEIPNSPDKKGKIDIGGWNVKTEVL